MLGLALLFLLIALIAFVFGEGMVGAMALVIAKWCVIIFFVLLLLGLVLSAAAPAPYWGWPVYSRW